MKFLRYSFVYPFLLFAALLTAGVAVAWTGPLSTAPACTSGNPGCDAPLNVSGTAQSKVGGLLVNTGGATNGLIVQSGNVGIGTVSPGVKLDLVTNSPSNWASHIANTGSNSLGLYVQTATDGNVSIGALNAAGNSWGFYATGGGYVAISSSLNVGGGTIYGYNGGTSINYIYDQDNRGYYLDLNNTTNMAELIVGGSYACRENGAHCPAAAVTHNFGGTYGKPGGGCGPAGWGNALYGNQCGCPPGYGAYPTGTIMEYWGGAWQFGGNYGYVCFN